MKKIKFFLDFEKEEQWLADMACEGYELVGANLFYHFEKAAPENIRIRIDHRIFLHQADFVNYCALFEDSGWKHIAGTMNSGSQYFKQISPDGDEDIFSDALSKAERYKRVSRISLSMAVAFLIILAGLLISGSMDWQAFFQPARFYLTPGLWERTGNAFWEAFWFETPFALFRAIMAYFFPLAIFSYIFFSVKSTSLYRKGLDKSAQ